LGVVGSGEAGLLLGTNSTLRASFQGFVRYPEHTVWIQQHVVPDRFTVSASSMAGSSVLAWFKDMCFGEQRSGDEARVYRELESLAASIQPGCDGLLFHPYLYGERSPFYNPGARGSFLAITHWHGKGHFVRSVMEGVAFCIANCFGSIESIARGRNESIETIRTGESGGSRLPIWRQIITDVLGFPLEVVRVEEPGCLGAALLAGVGVGEYEDLRSAIDQTVRIGSQTCPDSKNADLYRERRMLFNETYQALEAVLYQQEAT
jgi:xylulokinase